MTPTTCAAWLRELTTHPADHTLLAAYAFLTHLSQAPAHHSLTHLSQAPAPDTDPPIRFTHTTDLALPVGELQAVVRDPAEPTRHLVATTIAGPLGHDTPLPLALADELDHPLAHALLDSFHHRRTLLLCRGLLAADLAATLDGRDLWSRRIAGLAGLTNLADLNLTSLTNLADPNLTATNLADPTNLTATNLAGLTNLADLTNLTNLTNLTATTNLAAPTNLADFDPLAALRLAPIFIAGDRSPRALNLALRRLIPGLGPRVQLRVEPLPGRLIPLTADQHTRLGGPVARLGDTAALGHAVCLPGSAARLVLGPIESSARASLEPGRPAHALLHELLAAFIPEPLALELQLELHDLSLPPARLGQRALGRDLWLSPITRPGPPIRVPLPLTPARPPCPSPACRSASTTAAAA